MVRFLTVASGLSLSLLGCTAKHASNSSSQVTIQFPSVQDFSQSASSVSSSSIKEGMRAIAGMKGSVTPYQFAQACFAINVTAPDIQASTLNTCSVPLGIFQGFVAPGGSLSLTVPQGTGRTLEVFSYLRASTAEPCPTGVANMKGLDVSRLSRVGLIASFDAESANVNLTVNLVDPGSATLVSQYSMPNTCEPAPPPLSSASAAITSGRATASGGNYTVVGAVSGLKNEVSLQGGKYQIRLSRSAQ